MKAGFRIKVVTVTERGFSYRTHRLTGWLDGRRIREQYRSKDEALGRKNVLEVQAANVGSDVKARTTRLSEAQLAEAEAAFSTLSGRSLSAAVSWYLTHYRPPVTPTTIETAVKAFLAERGQHVRARVLADYKRTLGYLEKAFPGGLVHEITTARIQEFLASRNVGKKRLNNLRGDLHAFFGYCRMMPREWIQNNPVTPIPQFRITRGLPTVITAKQAADLMAYVETYAGAQRSELQPGCMVPYFALCLFAGIRPAVSGGEIAKLAAPEAKDAINLTLGTITLAPKVSKVKCVRRVTIQPNLMQWLVRYPISKYPIMPPNSLKMIGEIRKKFSLGHDVLRHTFISYHVAKFKSMGDAALQAGNSEPMIRKHYYNVVTEADAIAFWNITPGAQAAVGEVVDLQATG